MDESEHHSLHSERVSLNLTMAKMTVAELLVETLVAAGVKRVFGVVGDSLMEKTTRRVFTGCQSRPVYSVGITR